MRIERYLKTKQTRLERSLRSALPKVKEHPEALVEAMRYAVLGGGKRIRPILTLAACEAVGGKESQALSAALAIELIHSYSLVHDDLPCMDNDAMRRGKPSCHAKYGEVTALLAGDALLTRAFEILSGPPQPDTPRQTRRLLQASHWISEAAGARGMVGGQALDMELTGRREKPDLPHLEYINSRKTGALIAVCTRAGALLGGGTPRQVEALHRYGLALGLLFQVVDDIMDRQGYSEVIGPGEARSVAQRLLEKAKKATTPLGSRGLILCQIAERMAHRTE